MDIDVNSLRAFLDTEPVADNTRDIDFNFETVSEKTMDSGLESMADRMYQKFCRKHYALIADMAQIGLPDVGHQFRLVTRRSFNAIQFVEFVANNETIVDLRMVVYSINFQAAEKLVELIDAGKIKGAEILISNLRNGAHREKERVMKDLFMSHEKIKLFYCSSHAKLLSCSTEQGNHYTIEGSGNMSNNSRVEQYVIDNDEGLFEFTCAWMNEIKEFLKGKKELEVCGEING